MISLLELARRYYVTIWQGWGGKKNQIAASWRYQHSNNRGKSVIADWTSTEHLYTIATRLKQAFIECDDAIKIIERYDQPHTLFYLDPPYLAETRADRWRLNGYKTEADNKYHQRLLELLQTIQGMAILSGYPSEMYQDTLADWRTESKRSRTTNTANVKTERLWISPSIANAQPVLL